MTLSAGVGVCAKAPKAGTSAAAKPTAFQPANMRIIIPLVFAPVHHGPPARRPPLSAPTSFFIHLLRGEMPLMSPTLTGWQDSNRGSAAGIHRGRAT